MRLVLCMLCISTAGAGPSDACAASTAPIEVQFRGCHATGWCQFAVESNDSAPLMVHVLHDGLPKNAAIGIAVRDRLNALLSSMIHQHKRIELSNLRALDGGGFAANVTVNGSDLASDPVLAELRKKLDSQADNK